MKAPVAHDGYWRVAKRLLLWASGLVGIVGVALLCLLPSLVMGVDHRHQKSDRAQLDVANIHYALRVYQRKMGTWPPEATWSEALVAKQILERAPVDPWDQAYRYQLEASDGGEHAPRVTSVGPDGEEDTLDDLPARTPFQQ